MRVYAGTVKGNHTVKGNYTEQHPTTVTLEVSDPLHALLSFVACLTESACPASCKSPDQVSNWQAAQPVSPAKAESDVLCCAHLKPAAWPPAGRFLVLQGRKQQHPCCLHSIDTCTRQKTACTHTWHVWQDPRHQAVPILAVSMCTCNRHAIAWVLRKAHKQGVPPESIPPA